jgi:simple sugar transport system ATP-binding protein
MAQSLSGGNLQKYIVGRELAQRPAVLIAAQPTWGVDVGAAAAIRAKLLALRDAGAAVLVISEELEELFEVSDWLQVMFRGRLSAPVRADATDIDHVGLAMAGDFAALEGGVEPEAGAVAAHG